MLTDFNQELTMKKVILASLLATMMGTSPVSYTHLTLPTTPYV